MQLKKVNIEIFDNDHFEVEVLEVNLPPDADDDAIHEACASVFDEWLTENSENFDDFYWISDF